MWKREVGKNETTRMTSSISSKFVWNVKKNIWETENWKERKRKNCETKYYGWKNGQSELKSISPVVIRKYDK